MADLIDRQALLEWFKNWFDFDELSVSNVTKIIKDAPSANEDAIVTEYCHKRNLVIITKEFAEFCKHQYSTFYAKDERS